MPIMPMATPTFCTLIAASELQALQAAGTPLVLLDCGFDLTNPDAGAQAHAAGHLPGALYAQLDTDLAGAKSGRNGRHPLPGFAAMAATAGRWGVAPGVQVVCYDNQGGPYAARAWWLLRWLGHAGVAVLDGGVAAWRAAGGAMVTDVSTVISTVNRTSTRTSTGTVTPQAPYPAIAPAMPTIDTATLQAGLGNLRLFDARAGERFRGELEPLDPVAGHIPGATLRFFKDNLAPDGHFKPAAQLRAEFQTLAALDAAGTPVVQQCGSGVTACHNLLAMAHAGLGITTLYPGSWSEWCSDPQRPLALG